MKKVRKAIIPAAGLGTRFLPATKAQPKEMLPIIDTPIIQYIVQEAIDSGIEEILIITGKNKKSIEDHFDRSFELEYELEARGKSELLGVVQGISNMIDIHYVRQKHQLGLGHAVKCARTFVGNEPFAVLLGDDIVKTNGGEPCLKQLINVYNKYNNSVLGVQKVDESQVDKYGIVSGTRIEDRIYKVEALTEKPSVEEVDSNIAILGRYILEPAIFEAIDNTKIGKGGEIQLTDALVNLSKFKNILAYNFIGKRHDAGDKLGYLKATVEFALEKEDLKDEFSQYLKSLDI